MTFGDDEGGRSAHANEGDPPQKRARDAKYAIPTMAEASLLRETEGKLFEGNLLRLEVEELLGEVRVDYGKKSVKALEVRERSVGWIGAEEYWTDCCLSILRPSQPITHRCVDWRLRTGFVWATRASTPPFFRHMFF